MRYVNTALRSTTTGEWVQILPPDMGVGNGGNIAFGVASTRVSLNGAAVVRLACDQDCYVSFGDAAVVAAAGDILVPSGKELMCVPEGATHIAVIQSTGAGTLNWRKLG